MVTALYSGVWRPERPFDDLRVLGAAGGLSTAPVRLDEDTVLLIDGANYDTVQRVAPNRSPLETRTAIAVGNGANACAGPTFDTDKYGQCVGLNQTIATAHVSCPVPALTTATAWAIQGEVQYLKSGASTYLARISGYPDAPLVSASGYFQWYDGVTYHASLFPIATLTGVALTERWEWVAVASGTALDVYVRAYGAGSWVSAISGATLDGAVSLTGATLYAGSTSTGAGFKGKYRSLVVRDGDENAAIVADLPVDPSVYDTLADGGAATDAHGVEWTIERPASDTSAARVMPSRTERCISLPGVAGEYVSTPDTVALSITGDITLMAKFHFDGTPSTTYYLVNKSYNAAGRLGYSLGVTNTGRVFARHSADGSTNCGGSYFTSAGALEAAVGTGVDVAVAVVITVDNGAGGSTYDFYYSTDDGETWAGLALNLTVTGASGAIWDNSEPLEVGSFNSGGNNQYNGYVYWAEVRSSASLTGPLVERIAAADAPTNGTTWASPTSGATITLNKSSSAQYHAKVVPAHTVVFQSDGVDDYMQVIGDDTITDFDPAVGLTIVLDGNVPVADSGGVVASSANASTDDGVIVSMNSTNPRIQGRVDDGTTVATVGDNADNITFGTRFQAAFAFGSADHEAYVAGVSVESATDNVTAETAAGALRFFGEIDGSNPLAADLYGAAVIRRRITDDEAATIATEGLFA